MLQKNFDVLATSLSVLLFILILQENYSFPVCIQLKF